MSDGDDLHPDTIAAQALGIIDDATGAVVPPVHMATTFERDADNSYSRGHSYARDQNPTYGPTERVLNALEGGASALLFASGMAAGTAPFQALEPGDHVVAPRVMYWGLRHWLQDFATRWGLDVSFVDNGDMDALAAAIRPGATKLVWIETPANPLWTVTDIAAAAELAKGAGARLGVDSTVATPILTRPLSLGADIVMHSATKYLNGHSDVMAGALVTANEDSYWERVRAVRAEGGAIAGSFESWLLLRGMRTLPLRVQRSCENALTVAEHLSEHPKVLAVHYPGLASDPGHAV
ncbi:MAG: PLP-dependent aspartate aminotransferase family protein, partial [Pseudomonadota bacterium]